MTTDARPNSQSLAPEPSHPCLRCGAPIAVSDALCRACNPGGLKQPAASQAHGTVYLGIALAVVGLGAAATVLLGGVGPFTARVQAAVPAPGGLALTLVVANDGSRDGQASCRIWDPTYLGTPAVETFIRTPSIPAGQSLTFQQVVADLGTTIRPLAADCSR